MAEPTKDSRGILLISETTSRSESSETREEIPLDMADAQWIASRGATPLESEIDCALMMIDEVASMNLKPGKLSSFFPTWVPSGRPSTFDTTQTTSSHVRTEV